MTGRRVYRTGVAETGGFGSSSPRQVGYFTLLMETGRLHGGLALYCIT